MKEDINFIDKTGQPRSDKDLQEAIDVCGQIAVKHTLEIPILTIHIMDIIALLKELRSYRKLIADLKARKGVA